TTQGAAYTSTLQATGGAGTRTWSISQGTLPAGLSLNTATGDISGNPTSVGNSAFTVQVQDSGVPVQVPFAVLTISVLPAGSVLSFTVQPGDSAAGQAITPTVQVKLADSANAGIAGVTLTISIGTNPSAGTLAGILTAVTNASGI